MPFLGPARRGLATADPAGGAVRAAGTDGKCAAHAPRTETSAAPNSFLFQAGARSFYRRLPRRPRSQLPLRFITQPRLCLMKEPLPHTPQGGTGERRRGRAAWGRGGSGADLRAYPRLCSENPEHELLLLKHRNDFRVSSKIHVPPPRTQCLDSGICADVESGLGLHRGKVATPSDRVCACPSAHTGPHLYRPPLTDLRVTTANDKDTVLKMLVKTTAKLKDCTCTKC